MKKSIETIWKEGFISDESLKAPKIDSLASLKSIYFIDKFRANYKKNVISLTLTAIIVLIAFILGGVPIIGFYVFLLFLTLAIIGQIELNKLNELTPWLSNYEFLENFDDWLKKMLSRFSAIYRVWIPLLFIGFALALLKTSFFVPFIGKTLTELISGDQAAVSIAGIPLFLLIGILIISIVLSYFSFTLFQKEMKSIYGDLLGRIEKLLIEIRELK